MQPGNDSVAQGQPRTRSSEASPPAGPEGQFPAGPPPFPQVSLRSEDVSSVPSKCAAAGLRRALLAGQWWAHVPPEAERWGVLSSVI